MAVHLVRLMVVQDRLQENYHNLVFSIELFMYLPFLLSLLLPLLLTHKCCGDHAQKGYNLSDLQAIIQIIQI